MTRKFELASKIPDTVQTASDGMLIEPFFRNREEAIRIKRLQTQTERWKFSDAFALVGCVRCGTKQRPHHACGFCAACYRWYSNVLQKVLRARQREGEQ